MSLEKFVAILTFAVICVAVTMEVAVGRSKMNGVGPIQYELPESGAALQNAIVKAKPGAIQANTYFDFLFIAAYAVYFILAALLFRGAPSLRWPTALVRARLRRGRIRHHRPRHPACDFNRHAARLPRPCRVRGADPQNVNLM